MAWKGKSEGNRYFERAMQIRSQDPRVYRLYIQALLTQNEVSEDLLRDLTQSLVRRAKPTDGRAWLTACAAELRMQNFDQAAAYLAKVDDVLLQPAKEALGKRIPHQN